MGASDWGQLIGGGAFGRTPNLIWQYVGRGLILGGQSRSHTKGRRPGAPQFWRFLSTYAYTLYRRTTKFERGNIYGEGFIFRGQPRPHPKRRGPALPIFFGSLLFICIPFVAELPNLTW